MATYDGWDTTARDTAPVIQQEIQFTQDRVDWHDGPARGGDLFFRTRTVIDRQPTKWRAYCLPSILIGMPVHAVWHALNDIPDPVPVEQYDAFGDLLDIVNEVIKER